MYKKNYGNGKNLYLGFHGWGGDHRTFEPLIPYIPENVTLISVDLPGYGLTIEPIHWKLDSLLSPILEELTKLETKKFSIIGNCSGAIIALLVAQKIPDRIEKLFLIDPLAYTPWYFKIFLNRYFGKQAYNTTFSTSFGRWLTNLSLKHRRTKDSNLTSSFKSINHKTVYQYLRLLDSIGDYNLFREITIPIKIIYGAKTFKSVHKSVSLWSNIFPNSESYKLSNAAHLPLEEATEKISQLLFF
jgi:pimeloyl-ACP methyl ester carboxylesterase